MPRKNTARAFGWCLVLMACVLSPAATMAQQDTPAALDLGQAVGGESLGRHLEVFEDTSAERSLAEVVAGGEGIAFEPNTAPTPSFGFSLSAVWLRFTVDNPEVESREWLLEFSYPHVDYVDLYVPDGQGGFSVRHSGDRVPFATRDIAYRNVVFRIKQPPGPATYYVRAQTQGSLTLPLVAWDSDAFMGHLNAQQPALWMFYGVLIAIALYNLFIYFSVRRIAYLYYVTYTLAYALFQFVLNGLAFQYLWPDSVWWANQCMPSAIAFAFFAGTQFHRHFMNLKREIPWLDRILAVLGTYGGLAAALISLVIPYQYGIRLVVVLGTIVIGFALTSSTKLVLRHYRPAYFYLVAWAAFLVGILLYLLKTMNLVPTNAATEWAIQIGASLEVILLSLGLADQINVMRRDLQVLNGKLTDNVEELEGALTRAEQAKRAKSEFLAGVSHELRTPLNSIINIPEGLLEDFAASETARCTHCSSRFELDPGDEVDATTACPECERVGSLERQRLYSYGGDPERSMRYLGQVVRSGTHLLEVVNDILDVSRLEAGRMRLSMADVDMRELIDGVIAPMAGLADRKGVVLDIEAPPRPCVVHGDATKLGQILINLVGNAIKFSDGRGTVRLSTRVQEGHFVFVVQDQGVGISQPDLVRVFESFVQAEGGGTRRFGGSGLGLAITKKLVSLHGGEIWAESTLGEGSAFYVRLPAAGQGEHDAQAAASDGELGMSEGAPT